MNRRIILPISLALLCAAAVFAVLFINIQHESVLPSVGWRSGGAETLDAQNVPYAGSLEEGAVLSMAAGDRAQLRGDARSAEAAYRRAVELRGGVPALRKLAGAQLQRRQYDELQRTIAALADAGGRAEDILLLQSLLLLHTGELQQAADTLSKSDSSPQQEYGLALLHIVQGEHQKAQEELSRAALGWDPTLRTSANVLQDAYKEYQLFPESPESHLQTLLGRALAEVQECELALPLLVGVTQTNADYRDAWIVQGYCELATERFEQARTSLEHAYNLDPQKPEIQYFLGRTYAVLGDTATATTFLNFALQNGFQPEADLREELAQLALQLGDSAAAQTHLLRLVELPDSTPETAAGLVEAASAAGATETAQAVVTSALTRWPDNAVLTQLRMTLPTATGATLPQK